MRTLLLILISSLAATAAVAQDLPPAERQQAVKAVPGKALTKTLPMKRTAGKSNPCASYGPRFTMIEGTTTCVRIGGAISVETSVRR
jgi:hypothetical protein